jgi:hypothetical protein
VTLDAPSPACERARAWAALAPDGELSMLELRLLQAHVERCGACARIAADIEAISDTIRSTPLEPPPRQIALPALRRGTMLRRTMARRVPPARAAGRLAAVAAVGLLAFTIGSWSSNEIVGSVPVRPLVIDEADMAAADKEPTELRVFRRAALLSETPAAPRVGKRPGPQPL